MAQAVVDRFGGEVPSALEDLVTLPGVGRKTANVVRSVWFDEPGLPVDTHVIRLSHRLGLTEETDPVKIELALNAIVAARGAWWAEPAPHPPRTQGVRSALPEVRHLRPGGHLPLLSPAP